MKWKAGSKSSIKLLNLYLQWLREKGKLPILRIYYRTLLLQMIKIKKYEQLIINLFTT